MYVKICITLEYYIYTCKNMYELIFIGGDICTYTYIYIYIYIYIIHKIHNVWFV